MLGGFGNQSTEVCASWFELPSVVPQHADRSACWLTELLFPIRTVPSLKQSGGNDHLKEAVHFQTLTLMKC